MYCSSHVHVVRNQPGVKLISCRCYPTCSRNRRTDHVRCGLIRVIGGHVVTIVFQIILFQCRYDLGIILESANIGICKFYRSQMKLSVSHSLHGDGGGGCAYPNIQLGMGCVSQYVPVCLGVEGVWTGGVDRGVCRGVDGRMYIPPSEMVT